MNQFATRPLSLSKNASNNNAGPRVIIRYSSDGGYFSQSTKAKMVSSQVAWMVQGVGSPYAFVARSTMNPAMSAAPAPNRNRVLERGSLLNNGASEYPSAMTPGQGTSGYTTSNLTEGENCTTPCSCRSFHTHLRDPRS